MTNEEFVKLAQRLEKEFVYHALVGFTQSDSSEADYDVACSMPPDLGGAINITACFLSYICSAHEVPLIRVIELITDIIWRNIKRHDTSLAELDPINNEPI